MIWLAILLLSIAVLAPLALALLRPTPPRGRGEADVALYRAQLAELDQQLAEGRLDADAHRTATLEVQRRLLTAPEAPAPAGPLRPSPRVLAGLAAVPVFAVGLYLILGTPEMPSAPFAMRQQIQREDDELLAQLRGRISTLDQNTDAARQGWVLLANAERNRGNMAAAAEGYRRALTTRFDADITAQLAQVLLEEDKVEDAARVLTEALPRAPQHVGLRFLTGLAEERAGRPASARAAWRALLADAPEGAPWRIMVQRRLDALP